MAVQQLGSMNGEVPTGTGGGTSSSVSKQHKRKSSSLSYSEYIQFQQADEELFPPSPPETPVRRFVSQTQQQQPSPHQLNDTGADSDSGSHCALLPSGAASATASPAGQSSQHQRRLIKDWEMATASAANAATSVDSPVTSGGGGSNSSASWIQPAVQQLQQQQQQQQQQHNNGWPGRPNGNNNEYHELREIKQTQI